MGPRVGPGNVTRRLASVIRPAPHSGTVGVMRTRPMAGRDVPVLGLGTWNMERDAADEAVRAIQRAVELGMTHLDTAEMYGNGKVEELIGRALVGRRGQVFLVSKVLPTNGTRAGVLRACERSLMRMRTDWIDMYLLHWRGDVPLA